MKLTNSNKEIYYSLTILIVPLVLLFGIVLHSKIKKGDVSEVSTASVIQNKFEYRINPFDSIKVAGRSAIVKDINSEEIFYQKNPDLILPLASITKLMSVMLVKEYALSENEIVTISANALETQGESFFFINENFELHKLLKMMLVASSNDAAAAVREHFESKTGLNFISEMNLLAAKIGMENTRFFNETGLDMINNTPGAVGTVSDLSILFEYILKNYPEIFEYSKMIRYDTYSGNGLYYQINNTNGIIPKLKNLIGTKTGYTDLASGNLGVIIDPDLNMPTIIIVLGSTYEGRFDDVLKLNNTLSEYFNYKINQN